jgi:hypothetical protein
MEDEILIAGLRGRCDKSYIDHRRLRLRRQEIAEDILQMFLDQRHESRRIGMIDESNSNLRH